MSRQLKSFAVSAALMLSVCASAFAGIRDYVGIVRYQYYPELVTTFTDYSNQLKKAGYDEYAEGFDEYLKGGFGSGFVYVAADGTNYVITNRHVIAEAASASFEIQDSETLESKVYEGLEIVATDDDIDLAILKFKDGERPFTTGLSFSTAKIDDGDDVWTAGYPVLADEPMWQLGKGNISNAKAKVDELLSGEISTLIQHTAPIDAGNSGGPLLVKGNGTAGFQVVGINTWKAIYRQDTNYSIPVSVLQNFINKSLNSKTDDAKAVAERNDAFVKLLSDSEADFTSIEKYISVQLASDKGFNYLKGVLKHADSASMKKVIEAFRESPVEGMRYAMAYFYWDFFHTTTETYTASSMELADGVYSTKLSSSDGKNVIDVYWMKDQGQFRIKSASFTEESPKYAAELDYGKINDGKFGFMPSPASFYINFCGIFNDIQPHFNIDFEAMTSDFVGYGIKWDFGKLESEKLMFGGGVFMTTRIPVGNDKIAFSFVLKAGADVDVFVASPGNSSNYTYESSDDLMALYLDYGVGFEGLYIGGSSADYGCGVSVELRKNVSTLFETDSIFDLTDKDILSLRVYGTIAF